jgi:SulP family sulfate permease
VTSAAVRLVRWVRFIPYPVIAGFLAASGWLLMTGGIEVVTQANLTLAPASWAMLYSSVYGPQVLVGLACLPGGPRSAGTFED